MEFLCLSFSFKSSTFLLRMREHEEGSDHHSILVVNICSYKTVESLPPALVTGRISGHNTNSGWYIRGVQVPAGF